MSAVQVECALCGPLIIDATTYCSNVICPTRALLKDTRGRSNRDQLEGLALQHGYSVRAVASATANVAHGPFTTTNPDRCAQVLDRAREITSGDRAKTHGDKLANHENIAALWSAYLMRRIETQDTLSGELKLTAHDVAVMMVLLKMARTLSGSFNLDDYVDAAGYAGVAAEVHRE